MNNRDLDPWHGHRKRDVEGKAHKSGHRHHQDKLTHNPPRDHSHKVDVRYDKKTFNKRWCRAAAQVGWFEEKTCR